MRKRFNVLGTSITCLLFIGLMLGLFFLGNRTQKEQTKVATTSSSQEISARDKVIANYLDQMTLEEKVGQMIFARMPSAGQTGALETYHFGGYILFASDFEGKTLEQVKEEIASYQSLSKVPLLMASDEEGGTVTRISQLLETPFASPLELYQAGGIEAILSDAKQKTSLLKEEGIYAGFFPVADLSTNPSSFIYDRTIGQDAKTTADYIGQLVKLLKQEQFTSTLKHFPGYGDNADSHTDLVYDNRSLEELRTNDFLPFKAGIEAGADSIMVSHNIVPAIDNVPSSISPEINKILRNELGFEGVIMTDDFDMQGLVQFVDQDTGALQTIQAGTDMILSSSYASQIPYIIEQVKSGTITEERIDQSVKRILGMKYDLGLIK
ncbi:glycoside hydrolase family 3 protein [Streptococcus suis]|uniref:glycoside hydrolase family 3 protein n=1 Tax=Streptococcus suis TaxID=1307 RepID=UPI0004278683|nr:glycoside hydrolase family 3 N-terminal domain-containing protein [Streptococcus suis]MCK3871456.1 beta-hexosaminidase [Streptococcus suis]NQK24099.1 beta-hexosaminidase [Streptococcus suis]NQL17243.1 beta-hexosaminidase [Streptococcus suis]HEM3180146.1 beta-hexosaminidase [Streptococcus suis 92-4172]HEM4146628.1 beta-hexosaminidase [Streptococcus suis]